MAFAFEADAYAAVFGQDRKGREDIVVMMMMEFGWE